MAVISPEELNIFGKYVPARTRVSPFLPELEKDLARPSNRLKKMFASMETSGDITGDYLQLEESTFNDLKRRGKVRKDIKFGDLKNPEVYDEVARKYIQDLKTTFGIPTEREAALWSWRPGWYKKYGGKIENIPLDVPGVAGKPARQNMEDRLRNLRQLESSNTRPLSTLISPEEEKTIFRRKVYPAKEEYDWWKGKKKPIPILRALTPEEKRLPVYIPSREAVFEAQVKSAADKILSKIPKEKREKPEAEYLLPKIVWTGLFPQYEVGVRTPQNILVPALKEEGVKSALKSVFGLAPERSLMELAPEKYRARHPYITTVSAILIDLIGAYGIHRALTPKEQLSIQEKVALEAQRKTRPFKWPKTNIEAEVNEAISSAMEKARSVGRTIEPAMLRRQLIDQIGRVVKHINKPATPDSLKWSLYNKFLKPGQIKNMVLGEAPVKPPYAKLPVTGRIIKMYAGAPMGKAEIQRIINDLNRIDPTLTKSALAAMPISQLQKLYKEKIVSRPTEELQEEITTPRIISTEPRFAAALKLGAKWATATGKKMTSAKALDAIKRTLGKGRYVVKGGTEPNEIIIEEIEGKPMPALAEKIKRVKIGKLAEELRSQKLKQIAAQLQKLVDIAPHLVTPQQQAYAHILKERKMLTDRQYRRLMKIFTGKKTMRIKTPTGKLKKAPIGKAEAADFIEAEKRLVTKEIGEGIVLPRKKSLVPASFFAKPPPEMAGLDIRPGPAEGKPAGILNRFTPTARYMRKIGAYETVYRPMKLAYWGRNAENEELRKAEINWFKGVKENSPRDVAMFEYKEATMSPESRQVITEADKKNSDEIGEKFAAFLQRINSTRIKLNKKPIEPLQNYAPHIFDVVAQEALKEKHPLSNETLAALNEFVISTKTTGRFLQRRLGAPNYRKSLQAAWKAYKNMALDIIHYAQPTHAAKAYIKYYPSTTQDYLKAFLREGMFRNSGRIEKEIKESFKDLETHLQKFPLLQRQSLNRSVFDAGRALIHIGGIGLNYTTIIKNSTQSVLTYNLVNTNDTALAIKLLNTDIRRFARIANTNPMFIGRFPFEIREVDLIRLLQATVLPYRAVDVFNVAFAYNAGLIHELRPMAKARGVTINQVLDEYLSLYEGDRAKVIDDMQTGLNYGKQIEDAISLTAEMSQWSYYKMDLPRVFWTEPSATAMIFQSWPLYKTLHHYPELFNRLFKGKDFKGRDVSLEQRAGILKDLCLMALIVAGLAKLGIDIKRTWGPGAISIPFVNSPYVKLALGFSKIMSGIFTDNEKTRNWFINEGMRDIKDTMWLFVPAGIAIRREFKRFGKEEKISKTRLISPTELEGVPQRKGRVISPDEL